MRPGQQNKRSRGRNGRKNINPLSRNYESNGPDVKVRGNAAHVAEKYVQLARDASASGDLVMAENYFQHAEHYFRVISAAQSQFQQQQRQEHSPSPDTHDTQDGQDTDDGEDHGFRRGGDDGAGQMNGHESGASQNSGADAANRENSGGNAGDDQRPRRHRRGGRRDSAPSEGNLAGSPQPSINGTASEDAVPAPEDEASSAK